MDDFDMPVSIIVWQPRAMAALELETVMALRPRAGTGGLTKGDLRSVLACAKAYLATIPGSDDLMSVQLFERALDEPQ